LLKTGGAAVLADKKFWAEAWDKSMT